MSRRALRASLAAALLALLPGARPAEAAGRKPYHGVVTVPVGDLLGATDPHAARGPDDRVVASLVHARLVVPDGAGGVRPELAAELPTVTGRGLVFTLVDGATFHDGSPVRAADVVLSLRRAGQAADKAGVGALFAALGVDESDGRVVVTPPRGASTAEVLALLARPEAAILEGGRPGTDRGAGPFRPAGDGARAYRLDAFAGAARGRPFLDAVQLKRVADTEAERTAFAFGELDLSDEDSTRGRRVGRPVASGRVTWLAIPNPRFSGDGASDLRRAVAVLAARARLGRFVEARPLDGDGLWPRGVGPSDDAITPPTAPPALPALTIAYRADDRELGDLARALRDTLRPMVSGTARVVAVPGLDAAAARGAPRPDWDFALVRHVWAATTPAQAALELALTVGIAPPDAASVLAGDVRRWADLAVKRARAIPILHCDAPLLVRPGVNVAPEAPGVPDLADGWRSR
ncbi:MAG: hypothetical protein H6745_13780 [Deltaproteobacteria bacterium]|nr:hypothetical protein [Deltaproteobacteria bacterium]